VSENPLCVLTLM